MIALVGFSGCAVREAPVLRCDGPRTPLIREDPDRYFHATDADGAASAGPRDFRGGWKVVLESDVRNGWLVPIGESVDRRVELTGPSSFRCALGVAGHGESPVTVRLTVGSENGEIREVNETTLPGGSGTWMPFETDLGTLAGKVVGLRVEASAPGHETDFGPVCVANPEVVSTSSDARPPSLLLISIDTLRSDHLDLDGPSTSLTPHLARWAERSAVAFPNAIAAAPWTLPAHVSLLTGIDAVRHGVNHDVGSLRTPHGPESVSRLEFMAETLRQAGYGTAAFTGGAYVRHDFGFSQGFEQYVSWPDRARDRRELPTGIDRSIRFLRRRSHEPSFVFLHTYAVHDPYRAWPGHFDPEGGSDGPRARIALVSPKNRPETAFRQVNELVYRPPGGTPRPIGDDELALANRMYDSGVRFVDAQLGSLLETLRREGLDQNLIVVITSDHGESLGEGQRFGHVDLTDEVIRIPVVAAFPGREGAGRVIDEQIRQVDIWPTIADFLGIRLQQHWDGRSTRPLIEGRPWDDREAAWTYSAAANRGLGLRIGNRWKAVFDNTAWLGAKPGLRVFDLSADPLEVGSAEPDAADRPAWSSAVERYLDRTAPGLRLDLDNRSDHQFSADLEGAMIRPVGTTVLSLDGPRMRWKAMGAAEVTIPPGRSAAYRFEKVFGRALAIRGTLDGRVIEKTFDVAADRERGTECWDDGGRITEHRDDALICITVSLAGVEATLERGPAPHRQEVVDQLRALGYVE